MSNTTKHSFRVDIHSDGLFIIWTPYGPKTSQSAKAAITLMKALSERKRPFDSREAPETKTLQTETIEEYIARGGLIEIVGKQATPEPLTKAEIENFSLEDLGL